MVFTPKQINEIIILLQDIHWFYIAKNINPEVVPEKTLKILKRFGFNKKQIIKYPELAFQFGMLSVYLKNNQLKDLSFIDFKKIIKAKKFLPLTDVEKLAIKIIEQRAVEGITGLGNKISSNLRTIIIEGDLKKRREYEKIIKDVSKRAVIKREGIDYIKREIAKKTNDWTRDLDRIADFILHEAYDNGRAFSIKKIYGEDSLVYKRVHKEACDKCKKLYIKNTKTGEPKIFKLNVLLDNGTNIGVPTNKWKPVIGATHPWCRCELVHILPGYVWSNKERRFIPAEKTNSKLEKYRGKLKSKVTII